MASFLDNINPFKVKNELPPSLLQKERIVKVSQDQVQSFKNNFVKTSKYEIYNFIPKFLLEEFNPKTKFANVYFLIISAMQCVPSISNTNGIPTTLLPLVVVVFVDALFSLLEDINRHKADAKANASITIKYDFKTKTFVDVKWADIIIGDFIHLKSRELIPSDCIIISVAEKIDPPTGICYVETKSLDGETNLKIKNAIPCTMKKVRNSQDISSIMIGEVTMEHPNKDINNFVGKINLRNMETERVGKENVMLRGCVVRNTDWIIGLVVNTGHDTKIMMSSTETKAKTSNLESQASRQIGRIVMLLALICIGGATGSTVWNSVNNIENAWYLNMKKSTTFGYWITMFFYYFLLHASFIPVSLYVSMALTRSFQSYFMNNDLDMYYEPTDTPALVRTMTLNEELGQISHVFSDKTGTLTCNIMDFRKMSINGVSYGQGITEIGRAAWKMLGKDVPPEVLAGEAKARKNCANIPHVTFYCPKYEQEMKTNSEQKVAIRDFFKYLAICHDVIPEKIDGKLKLSASNPDDEAFVCASAFFGYEFCDRTEKSVVIKIAHEKKDEEIEMLETIAFTSARKRMSVIIRDSDGTIKIITKGADSAIIPRLASGQDALFKSTTDQLQQYSLEGLRCLLIGYALISEETYNGWKDRYKNACTNLEEVAKKDKSLPNLIDQLQDEIERNMSLLGVTAIEDRLQEGVPDCIETLAQAGVNIWMLTGDKEETAINIAVACNLIRPTEFMDHIIVNPKTCPDRKTMYNLLCSECKKVDDDMMTMKAHQIKPRALIIDGEALSLVFPQENPKAGNSATQSTDDRLIADLRTKLLEFSLHCKAVVGNRFAPDQKKLIVHMVKVGRPETRCLSIGDGANDVAMIQEAHIGVGIKGEEGVQAVNAADFAIAQFRYLSILMLKHGRYNYIRMSYLVCYMFYKNVFMSMAHWWFNFYDGWSGQKYYTEGFIQLFNLAFTAFPILMLSVYDMDISPEMIFRYPQIYKASINNEYFKTSTFWLWILTALCESVVLAFLSLFFMMNSNSTEDTHWSAGALCFTAVVFVVSSKIFFIQSRYYWANFLIIFLSLLFMYIVGFIIQSSQYLDANWFPSLFTITLGSDSYWIGLVLLITIVNGKDVYVAALERTFNYKPHHIIQEIEAKNLQSAHHVISSDPEALEVEMGRSSRAPVYSQKEDLVL